MKTLFTFLFFGICFPLLIAQQNNLMGILGAAYNWSNKAAGVSLSIDYDHLLSRKTALGMEINYLYTQKRGLLPNDIKAQNVILRDFTHIPPLTNLWWDENSFAPFRLSTKPDTYFDFNIVFKYLFEVWQSKQNHCRMGLGAVFNYHDEKEIVGFIQGRFRAGGGWSEIQDASIPLFQYDTYLDLGVLSQLGYERRVKDNLSLGLVSKWYVFPKSEKYMTTFSVFIDFKF
jgi:hypothetical protein